MTKEDFIELIVAMKNHKRNLINEGSKYAQIYDREIRAEVMLLQQIEWLLTDKDFCKTYIKNYKGE